MRKSLLLPIYVSLILMFSISSKAQLTFSTHISQGTDDSEEYVATGAHDLFSSDLEIIQETTSNTATKQIVALRFTNVNIPSNAIITSAKVQFTYDASKTLDPCVVYFKVEDSNNPITFDTTTFGLANRVKLTDSVEWVIPSWAGGSTGTRGPAQLSSNIATLIQQTVNRPGWSSGNAIALYITGSGTREAESYEGAQGHGNLTYAPQLIVEYFLPLTVNSFVNQGTDDVEERVNTGAMDITSSDLELVQESTTNPASLQKIGLRFQAINIPRGATIQDAYIQFTYDASKTLNPSIVHFRAEANANPTTFSSAAFSVSNRTWNSDSITWTIPSWAGGTTGTRGPNQKSPNIASLIQTLVNDTNWTSGNAMAFQIYGQGTREAESFEGAQGHSNLTYAPELVVTYLSSASPIAPIGTFPIDSSQVWNYYADSTAPAANWTSLTFNDSTWRFGNAELGYGDGDEATVIPFGPSATNKYPSYYFRHKFNYTPGSLAVDSLIFNIRRDDGAVVYLNGVEMFRDNMPSGTINYNTLALGAVAGADESKWFRFAVAPTALVNGLNVVSVSVHQNALNSSDLSFDLRLDKKIAPMPIDTIPFPTGSNWAYWDLGSIDSNWASLSFNDSSWAFGPGVLGYGDPVATTVGFGGNPSAKFTTTWFRKRINVNNYTSLPDTLEFRFRRDDGIIVYVNGVEIIRDNMPSGAITNNTFSTLTIDGSDESVFHSYLIPKTVFTAGNNVISVRIHQRSLSSSDITFDMEVKFPTPPPPPPAVASGCVGPNDTHIACFTSVQPAAQNSNLNLPATHRMQKIVESGDLYTKNNPGVPFLNIPGNNDFTAFVGKNGSATEGVITINHENTPGGVTIVDVKYDSALHIWNIDTTQAVNFYNNDLVTTSRNCSGGITPWRTIITAEETYSLGDANSDGYQDVGWLVEIDPSTKRVKEYGNGKQEKLWAMGRMRHENVTILPDSQTTYYSEDGGTSCVYKYIATQKGNLSAGTLYVLQLNNPLNSGVPTGTTGTWIQVPNTTQQDRNTTSTLAGALGGTAFSGPEDVEYHVIQDKVYFTSKGFGRTYRFKDNGAGVTQFEVFVGGTSYGINYGTGVANESWGGGNDNLVIDNRGNVWVLQDGSRNHIWMVGGAHTQANPKVELFAKTPAGSEPCGFEMTPDSRFAFLSIQHPSASNSSTFQLDVKGDTLRFNKSTSVIIARAEFLGPDFVNTSANPIIPSLKAKVFPNPNKGQFSIELHLDQREMLTGSLYDITGRLVYSFNNVLASGENRIDLNLDNSIVKPGMYVLLLKTPSKESSFKVVIN